MRIFLSSFLVFFFNDTATTEIYTLSLHDALPIFGRDHHHSLRWSQRELGEVDGDRHGDHDIGRQDRKSTRLNSSHQIISYAVFCLKKKNIRDTDIRSSSGSRYLQVLH